MVFSHLLEGVFHEHLDGHGCVQRVEKLSELFGFAREHAEKWFSRGWGAVDGCMKI